MSDITRDYSFGGWLQFFRKEKGMTLRDAARNLGIDPGNYCKMERSQVKPPKTAAEIERILKVLGAEKSLSLMKNLAFQDHLATLRMRFR